MHRASYVVDRDDPRAPTLEAWNAMTPEDRARVIAALPNEVPIDVMAPEGDAHRKAKWGSLEALDSHFRKIGRRVYLSSELAVYYPGERRIVPDLFAVLDVDPHERMKWVVAAEGKGLDFVLEVHLEGSARKDHERNVANYARLGIPEYFIFDRGKLRLNGHRLTDDDPGAYRPIIPQSGRFESRILGLDLGVEGQKLKFYSGNATLVEADELIARLSVMVDDLLTKREEAERAATSGAERAAAEAERAAAEAKRADAEAERAEAEKRRADAAERHLQEALGVIERLKRGR